MMLTNYDKMFGKHKFTFRYYHFSTIIFYGTQTNMTFLLFFIE